MSSTGTRTGTLAGFVNGMLRAAFQSLLGGPKKPPAIALEAHIPQRRCLVWRNKDVDLITWSFLLAAIAKYRSPLLFMFFRQRIAQHS